MTKIPAVDFQYPKPFNFDENSREFEIFKNLPSEHCPAPKLSFLKKIRVSNNSVAFNYFKIFEDSCIGREIFLRYQSNYKFFLKFIFPKFNFSKKRFLLIADEWTSNYCHWHVFALGRLAVLKEENLIEDSLILLPKKYQKSQMVMRSLEFFGIKKEQIVFIPKKSNIKVEQLVVTSIPYHHPITVNKFREVILAGIKNLKNNSDLGDKIYITRQGQWARYAENETQVRALLEKYGFKTVYAEKLTYDEQLAIFSKVKYLISPHGAGLTNFLFMPKDSFILELANKPKPNKIVTDYYKLAGLIGINYLYQECEIGATNKHITLDPHENSVDVDLEKLEKNLQLMLK